MRFEVISALAAAASTAYAAPAPVATTTAPTPVVRSVVDSTGAPKAPRQLVPFPNWIHRHSISLGTQGPEVASATSAPKSRRQLIPNTGVDVAIQDIVNYCFLPCLRDGQWSDGCLDKCAPLTDNMDADAKLQVSSGLDIDSPEARRQSTALTDDKTALLQHSLTSCFLPCLASSESEDAYSCAHECEYLLQGLLDDDETIDEFVDDLLDDVTGAIDGDDGFFGFDLDLPWDNDDDDDVPVGYKLPLELPY